MVIRTYWGGLWEWFLTSSYYPPTLDTSKNAQMCYFKPFFGIPLLTYPQSRGLSWKLKHWKFGPILFMVFYIYVGSVPFHFQRNFQWESFHRHRHRRSNHFFKFGWKIKIHFLGADKKIDFFNTYLISGTNGNVCFFRTKIFLFFLYILWFFDE